MTSAKPSQGLSAAIKPLVTVGVLLVALLSAAPAAADSLVFARANNIWLANADGSGQYQVTLDGTPSSPYSSPSQADDGTIVALRTPPGGRPQIWRMRQNGQLLNAPINTPAPGTGAIDARVSPDGQLVAYWFVTEVATGTCAYCIGLSSQVLISHSDRFTNPDEVGNPHTGSLPSWMSNNTLLMSNGNATQWYYTLGMSEGAEWWGDTDNCGCVNPVGLTDGEVTRDGQRIALVRGDNNETIVLYKTNGPPPAVPTPACVFTGPNGKFSGPTWSQDGQTLAWQEDNGISSAKIPDLTNCATITTPQLIVAGGSDPDFGPAAVNPGGRPACGNPGNPAACPGPGPGPGSGGTLAHRLSAFLSSCAKALKRFEINGLLHARQLAIAFTAPTAGTLTLQFTSRGHHPIVIAAAKFVFRAAGKHNVVLKPTKSGRKLLRGVRRLTATLSATFAPHRGSSASSTLRVSLSECGNVPCLAP